MDTQELAALIAVIETGSEQRAAAALGWPRSTVRRRLGSLEARVGVPLVARGAAGCVATPAGDAVAALGRPVIQQVHALLSHAREAPEDLSGSIRVATPVGMPPDLGAALIARMHALHPAVRMEVTPLPDPTRATGGEVDLILHFGPTVTRGPYRASALTRIPERLLASRAYLDARGRPERPEDLADHSLLSWKPPGEDATLWPGRDGSKVEVRPFFVSPDIHLVRTLVLAGQGIALLPDAPVAAGPEAHRLEPVLESQIGRDCVIWMLVPDGLASLPKTRLAIRMLRELVGD